MGPMKVWRWLVGPATERTRPIRRRIAPARYKETYINHTLARIGGDSLYLEIGVRDGASFRDVVATRKIGIDPVRTERMAVLRPGEEFFESTSDAFFREVDAVTLQPGSIDVALIDGLHEFRQIAQDFRNLEPFMRPTGVIFLDDFNPGSRERARDTPTGGPWNGDGWKLAVLLGRERTDLDLFTIDADEGIGVVTGFSPELPAGQRISDEKIDTYKQLDYDMLDRHRPSILNLISPKEFAQRMTWMDRR